VWERKYDESSLGVADKVGSLQVEHLSFPMGKSPLINVYVGGLMVDTQMQLLDLSMRS
jgi:hypothetical protein